MNVGVLALQGDFREHQEAFARIDVSSKLVRLPKDMVGITHLVFPGGESTAISMLLESSGLFEVIGEFLANQGACFGTCAGMILLSKEIHDGRADQIAFGGIDISVRRNGFGRQVDSFEADLQVKGLDAPMRGAFIRAPVVTRVGAGVEVLSSVTYDFGSNRIESVPAVCRNANVLVSSFHPEVTNDSRLHKLFVDDFRV